MVRASNTPVLDEAFAWATRQRNKKLAELRQRSGLSMQELAVAMGYSGQSSIQRYLQPDYDKGFRPEIVAKFRQALIGRGTPPITEEDFHILLDDQLMGAIGVKFDDRQPPAHDGVAGALTTIDRHAWKAGQMRAELPLIEGRFVVDMPPHMSQASAQAARSWLEHLISLASDTEGQRVAAEREKEAGNK